MKYAFVEKNRRQYGVPALCEALQVSRSGYYAARYRGPSNRQKRQVDLTARIRTIHQASRESYGAPRVHVELLAQEVPRCRNRWSARNAERATAIGTAIRRGQAPSKSPRVSRFAHQRRYGPVQVTRADCGAVRLTGATVAARADVGNQVVSRWTSSRHCP